MRVLVVAREYPPYIVGGVATHTYHLVRHMRALGVRVDVLSYGGDDLVVNEDGGSVLFLKAGSSVASRVDEGPLRDMLVPLDMVRYVAVAGRLIERVGYDVVHVEEPYIGGPIRHSAKVTTIHDTSYGELRAIVNARSFTPFMVRKSLFYSTLGYAMEFASIYSSRAVIAPSPQVRDELIHIYKCRGDKVYVIPNGVEAPSPGEVDGWEAKRLLGLEGYLVVFTTAQHIARKRLDVLLRAASLLRDKWRGRVKFVIGGDGPLTHELRRMALDLGLGDLVHFTGWIPGEMLPVYYRACDVFVVTSEYEAGPQTMLEAGIRGCPLVSSRIPFFPALVRDYVDGVTFRPGDYVELARVMDELLEDEGLRMRLSRGAVRFASRFTWDRVAEYTLRVYRRVLGEAG